MGLGAAIAVGREGWVLSGGPPSVGGALGWATRAGIERLHLVSDEPGGDAARQLAAFDLAGDVSRVVGRRVEPVAPSPLEVWPAPEPEALALVEVLEAAGADVVVEQGVVKAEVLGLEVARVVRGVTGAPEIAVGVGRHDREAHAMLLEAGTPTDLQRVIEMVRAQRTAGAPSSPASQLAPERWLRSVVMFTPSLVGALSLQPAPSPVARPDLRRPAPAPAIGVDQAVHPVLVVCSVGVDPDLVPAAADARLAAGSDIRLLLAVPEGDDLPVTRRLAGLLRHPAEVITVARDWRQWRPR
ncbi:MAG TPA: hypothetical protein VNY84_14405 [Acidimicrobiales bacterium]|nr:hypothetical protein [Acidimicrobiales bacterium]